ncbi:MAG: Uma2 family endonuclease [Halothece sp.]
MLTTVSQADRVVLNNISWEQFENLLAIFSEKSGVRIAYDQGLLEIMTPLPEHEYYKQVISTAIEDIAEVLEKNYECYGSTTWKDKIQSVGVEPDNCFYFQNEARVRGKLTFDLNTDPPPDLVLEIDLTSKSLNRFPIYGRIGVPEIWTYDQGKLTIYQLQSNETYQVVNQSSVFPEIPILELPNVIAQYQNQGRRSMRQGIRNWVKQMIMRN